MLNKDIHTTQLVFLLKEIYSLSNINKFLVFKGGTACYLFYGLNRVSVDLDFTLLDLEKEKFLLESIHNILQKNGEIIDEKIKRDTTFFLYRYSKDERNIKIEISKRKVPYINNHEILNYEGINMLVMGKEDMFANKLIAITERSKPLPRDLFDINFFFKEGWDFNNEIIKERSSMSVRVYFKEVLIKYIEKNFDDKNILDGIGDLIDSNTKNDVRQNLKKNVIFYLKNYLRNIDTIVVKKNARWIHITLVSVERITHYPMYKYTFMDDDNKNIVVAINLDNIQYLENDLDMVAKECIEEIIIFLYQFQKIKDTALYFSIGTDRNSKLDQIYEGIGKEIKGIFKTILDIQNEKELYIDVRWKILSDILYENYHSVTKFRMFNITFYTILFDIDKDYVKKIISDMKNKDLIKQKSAVITNLYDVRFDITNKGRKILERGLINFQY